MRKFYSSLGLVLAKYDYGEADSLFFVLTRDLGKITLVAKGVRRITSRKRSTLEVFNLISFKARKSKSLFFVEEVDLVWRFKRDVVGLKGISLAYYFSEVIDKILGENEPNKDVFDFSLAVFKKIHKAPNLRRLRLYFVKELLVLLGFWPKDKKMTDPDLVLESVLERDLNSKNIGVKILS